MATIEFGDWRLVPLDGSNWELCHRHAAKSGARKGEVSWHRLGRYYQWNTVGCALAYAADCEVKGGDRETVVRIEEALDRWKDTLRRFESDIRELLGAGSGEVSGTHE